MSKTAHILAIKVASLGDLGFGISNHPGDVDAIMQGEVWAGPRPALEEDRDFVQPIPYILLRKGGKVLAYRRGEAGGEGRLHGKVSVGIGGHVDAADARYDQDSVIDMVKTMSVAAQREVAEEIGLMPFAGAFKWTHVISVNDTPVDEVHIGLVAQLDFASFGVGENMDPESCMERVEWRDPAALLFDHQAGTIQLENWSVQVLNSIVNA
jgi:predicted NUDIX family phosphoesterase